MLIAKWKKQGYEKVCPSPLLQTGWKQRADGALVGIVVLPPMHTDQRDQFQFHMYLPSTQGAA